MKNQAQGFASITLDERGLCDLELLATGAFSPLKTFMSEADYDRVVKAQRLADGTLWPLPVTLPVRRPINSSGRSARLTTKALSNFSSPA